MAGFTRISEQLDTDTVEKIVNDYLDHMTQIIIGLGLVIVGAGIGLGRIGGQTAEAMARQPEAGADIRGATLVLAVLLEGATIIALVFALLFKLA